MPRPSGWAASRNGKIVDVFFGAWIFGRSFWAWREERKERRRLARGEPAPTNDPSGWRAELGFPMAESPDEAARLHRLETDAYKTIHDRGQKHHGSAAPDYSYVPIASAGPVAFSPRLGTVGGCRPESP